MAIFLKKTRIYSIENVFGRIIDVSAVDLIQIRFKKCWTSILLRKNLSELVIDRGTGISPWTTCNFDVKLRNYRNAAFELTIIHEICFQVVCIRYRWWSWLVRTALCIYWVHALVNVWTVDEPNRNDFTSSNDI